MAGLSASDFSPTDFMVDIPAPPRFPRGQIDWEGVARTAQRHPDQWILAVKGISTGMVYHLKKGRVRAMAPLVQDMSIVTRDSRMIGNSRYADLYVMYKPPTEAELARRRTKQRAIRAQEKEQRNG